MQMLERHFSIEEYQGRIKNVIASMEKNNLYILLLFRQESMYYLTGYDTSGYSMFQFMYLDIDGNTGILTRPADRIQAKLTAHVDKIETWSDSHNLDLEALILGFVKSFGKQQGRMGVEYHAYGLTASRGKMVDRALQDDYALEDASELVRDIRLIKSPQELKYAQQAGALCDQMVAKGVSLAVPGASIKRIHGEMTKVVTDGGGEPAASRWPAGAGKGALLSRFFSGENIIQPNDQVTFEPGAAFRHYHACSMISLVAGTATEKLINMKAVASEALDACFDVTKPGATLGEVYEAYKKTLQKNNYEQCLLSACGYPMGAMYPPTWMDFPMVYEGGPMVLQPGMVFFLHIIMSDDTDNTSASIGETVIVTDTGFKQITHVDRGMVTT